MRKVSKRITVDQIEEYTDNSKLFQVNSLDSNQNIRAIAMPGLVRIGYTKPEKEHQYSFVDIAKAFDIVWKEGLITKIIQVVEE